MKLAILANDIMKQEWLAKGSGSAELQWVNDVDALTAAQADAWFDLDFEDHPEHIGKLEAIQGPVFISSVIRPLVGSDASLSGDDSQLIRINAWPTFLNRELVEVCIGDPFDETVVREVFGAMGWNPRIVPDVPGMITPRIIAMIINEAFYTLHAEVSTKEEIDTAMKLGTNYPFGPFEWSEKIGLHRIHALLAALSKLDERYMPAENIQQHAAHS